MLSVEFPVLKTALENQRPQVHSAIKHVAEALLHLQALHPHSLAKEAAMIHRQALRIVKNRMYVKSLLYILLQ